MQINKNGIERVLWKPEGFVDISGYEGKYAINREGRIYVYGYIRDPSLNKPNIYARTSLIKNKKNKQHFMHRLIAEAHIPNPDNYPVINHKDGNKQNNSIDNLEWCTVTHNNKHAYDMGLKKNSVKQYNASAKQKRAIKYEDAEEIRRLYKTGNYTQRQLGDMCDIHHSTVSNIISGKNYKHKYFTEANRA